MQSYVVHIVGLIGNIIGFTYASSRYLGTGYAAAPHTWGLLDEMWGLIPMLLPAAGILINGLFLSLEKHFKILMLFTSISIVNSCFLIFDSTYDAIKNDWLYEQKLFLETPQIYLAFLSSSMILIFCIKSNKI